MVNSSSENTMTPNKVASPMILVFRSFGMWPSEKPSIFYRIYGISLLSIFSFLFTLTMFIQLFFFTKMEELTENSYMTLTEFALCVKILNFYLRSRSMQSHLITLNKFEMYNDAERQHMNKRLKFMFFLLMTDFALTNSSHVSTLSKILIFTSKREFGFSAWQPLDWENNTRDYWLSFTFQSIAMTITSNTNVVIQQFPSLMFCAVSAQMEILSMRLRSIGHKKIQKNSRLGAKGDTVVNDVSQKESKQILQSLVESINLHHKILEYGKYNFILFLNNCHNY